MTIDAPKCLELHNMAGDAMRAIRNVILGPWDDEGTKLLYEKVERVKYLLDEIIAETLPYG